MNFVFAQQSKCAEISFLHNLAPQIKTYLSFSFFLCFAFKFSSPKKCHYDMLSVSVLMVGERKFSEFEFKAKRL